MPELTEEMIRDSLNIFSQYGCEMARQSLLQVIELPLDNPLRSH